MKKNEKIEAEKTKLKQWIYSTTLSTRAKNVLVHVVMHSLSAKSEEYYIPLWAYKNCGRRTAKEINDYFFELNNKPYGS